MGKDDKSCIEDFFYPSVRKIKLSGKKFNARNEQLAADEYGKVVFATKVVRPNADKINFSKFAKILERIVAVMEDHQMSP